VYLLFQQKVYDEAEALLLELAPGTDKLIKAPEPVTFKALGNSGVISQLVTVYRAQGKNQLADQLASRLKLIDQEDLVENAFNFEVQNDLVLAEVKAAQQHYDQAMNYLQSAIDKGFLLNWRVLIAYNPVFTALHKDPRYIALINQLETEALRQKALQQVVDQR